jgi:hypothetical protein
MKKWVVSKKYDRKQPMTLPPSYEDLTQLNHPARLFEEGDGKN